MLFVSSWMKVEKIAIHRTYYARLWWLFSLMYSWQWPGHVINTEESMDTLLGSSRYTMGKALTSGPHHLQGPWNGSWATAASHTTRAAAFGELLFILLSPFHFSRQLSNLTKYPFNFFSQMTQKPWYNLTRPKNQTRKIRIPASTLSNIYPR